MQAARHVFSALLLRDGALAPGFDDDLVAACCVTRDGAVRFDG